MGRSSPEAEAKCEISVQFSTSSCRKFRINEYRSWAWTVTVFLWKHTIRKILKIQCGRFDLLP